MSDLAKRHVRQPSRKAIAMNDARIRGAAGAKTLLALVAAASISLATGCATVPRDAGFGDVQATVAKRTRERIQWTRGTREDAAARTAVKRMLGANLTADEAVQIALLNNRNLQAVYENLNLAQANLVQAGLLGNPVFDVGLGFPLDGGATDLSFGIVQEFLSILYRPLRKQIAGAEFEAVKLRVAEAVIELAAQARAGFYQVQADQQRIGFLQQVVESTGAAAELAQQLYKAGNIPDLDLAREQALYHESRLELATANLQLIQNRERLNALMGVWGQETRWSIAPRLPEIPATPMKVASLEGRAIAANLNLRAARQEIRSTAAVLGFTDATALIPFAESGVDAEREDGEWEVGPSFGVPLPIFDQGRARLVAARSDLRRAQHVYWAQAVEIRAAVRAAQAGVWSARRRASHVQNVLLPLATRVVNNTQLQYNAMQIGVFELLEAKREQINAGLQYIDALGDYWRARGALGQILSGRMADMESAATAQVSERFMSSFSAPAM